MDNQSSKLWYLKKAIKILLSLSVFSFLFSQSSSLVPFLVHSFDHYMSEFNIQIFTYKTERNLIFLLCNGILVLIIQTSGLISKITPVKPSTTPKARGTSTDLEEETAGKEFVHEKKVKGIINVEFLEQEKGLRLINSQDDDDDDDDDDRVSEVERNDDFSYNKLDQNAEEVSIIWEDEEEIDEDGEIISADELNKKCEDFIKKVKQEIQVEFSAGRLIIIDN